MPSQLPAHLNLHGDAIALLMMLSMENTLVLVWETCSQLVGWKTLTLLTSPLKPSKLNSPLLRN